jgi:ATP-binding cassette subfamily B protein/ATP-binding cassette subfamily C protein LapB
VTIPISSPTKESTLLKSFKDILDFYFGEITFEMIEKFSSNPLNEFSIQDIKDVSDELGLKTSLYVGHVNEIGAHHYPCIAVDRDGVAKIVNSKLDADKLERRKIEFIFFENTKDKREYLNIGEQKSKEWFYKPIKAQWRSYVEVGFLTLFINIFGLALPLFTMNVYNRVVPNFAVETLFVLAFGVGVILVFDVILKSSRVHILEKVAKSVTNELEEELFKKVLSVQSAYDNYMVGTKTNLFRELGVVKDFFATKLISLLDVPFFFTAVLVIYIIDPVMATVPVIAGLLLLSINFLMQFPIASLHRKSYKEAQSKHGYLVEQLQGQDAIKLSNALASRTFKWRRMLEFYNDLQGKISFLSALTAFLSQGILQSVSLFTIILGVFCIHDGSLSVGGLIAVTILASRAMAPIINLSNMLVKYRQVKEALNSLNDYWHLPMENQKHIELGIGKVEGEIEFENVSFSYPDMQSPSVKDLNFKIKKGEKVGIIGQTGAGKSTIQKLLTGLETPSEGRIFLDSHDIVSIHPVELRDNIALMPQEPYLFSGTLKENLELTRNISKKEMSDILKKTGLEKLVKGSAQSESLQVGERGSNLSVGQRHLVALARALMHQSPIIVLDEPTTGLDIGLEKQLVNHLNSTLKEKTMIVITHRFAALDLVDRVILLNDGKIVADGPKQKVLSMLLGQKG